MISSLIRFKCPKCHEGNLFVNPNPYNLKTIATMPKNCDSCGQAFQPEPGFYFGAMYISYGLGVLLFMTGFFIMEIILKISGYWFLGVYISALIVLWPIVFRISRVIYIYIFIRHDESATAKYKK